MCVDPFAEHRRSCRGTSVISNTLAQRLISLGLDSGDRLCPKCYMKCANLKEAFELDSDRAATMSSGEDVADTPYSPTTEASESRKRPAKDCESSKPSKCRNPDSKSCVDACASVYPNMSQTEIPGDDKSLLRDYKSFVSSLRVLRSPDKRSC